MKLCIFLAALIGLAATLQYPVEYHYQYEGRVAAGIPSIRSQLAALGIKAKVILQMKAKTQGLVKLLDIQVAEQNKDLECSELRRPIPFQWTPMPQKYKQLLEEPWAVYFEEEMNNVMQVPKNDLEFVTNIRKSVVEMLRIEPMVANLGGIKGDKFAQQIISAKGPKAFSLEEESIHGRCESQYTLEKLPPHLAQHVKQDLNQYVKEDEQTPSAKSKAGSLPILKEEYYRLERAVNFDKCHDMVLLQHAGLGNLTKNGWNQFKSLQARSSVSSYILKGQPGAFRIERAIVEGDVALNPFGYKTYRLQTITNQTLVLEKAQPITTKVQLPTTLKPVKTWRFEVASPYTAPSGHPKPWINFYSKNDKYFPTFSDYVLLGMPIEAPVAEQYKKNIIQLLDSAVHHLYSEPLPPSEVPSPQNTKSSVAVTQLHQVSRMLRAVPLAVVQKIFNEIWQQKDTTAQRKQMLLIDVAAASGASAPWKVLLDMMKKQEISPERIGSIFATLPNNLVHPSIIPDIMEYVKTLDLEKNPVLTSTALINFASLAERVCLNPKKFNYSVSNPVYGNQVCQPSLVINNFLPYLKQKMQQWKQPPEQAILIQAVSNLAIPQIIPVLKPYIYGKLTSNPRVRSVAIYGLTKRRLPLSAKEQVFETLMEIVDNLAEAPQVRQAAFISLLTWHPHAAWYQQMARKTWREPSQNFAAYVTFTFESIAKATEPHMHKQAEIAAFVLPLLKPYAPSVKYSFHAAYSSFDPVAKVGLNAKFDYIQSLWEIMPSTIYGSLRMNQGHWPIETIEAAFDSEGLSKLWYEIADQLQYPSTSEGHYTPQVPRDRSLRQASKLTDFMESNYQSGQPMPKQIDATLYLREFENMYQYIPLDPETISKVAGPEASNLLRQLHRGVKVNMTKFLHPIDLEYFHPTEIGLPLTGMIHMPMINIGDAEMKLVTQDLPNPTLSTLLKSKKIELLFKTNYKYASKLIVKLAVPAPWNKKVVEVGMENLREVNLPVKGNLTFSHNQEVKNLTMTVSPHMERKIPIIHGHNLPYTDLVDFIPSVQPRNMKVITVKNSRQPIIKFQEKLPEKFTGLDVELKYSADVSPPISSLVLFDYIRKPERLVKLIQSPTSKQYQYTVLLNPPREIKNISVSMAYLTPNLERSKQEQRKIDISPWDDVHQRLQKISQLSQRNQVYGVSTQLSFKGPQQYRKYEAFWAFTKQQPEESQKKYKALVSLLATPIPRMSYSPQVLCAYVDVTTPRVNSIEELKQKVAQEMKETIRAEVVYGKTCASSKMLTMNGKASISQERKEQVKYELDRVCNYDRLNPLVELQTTAVYDQAHLNFEWEQEKIPRTLLNLTYQAQEYLEGYLYPHGYFNNLHHGQRNKMNIEAKRPLSSQRYTFWVESPQKKSIYKEIRLPDLTTQIIPWWGLDVKYNQYGANPQMVLATRTSNVCHITTNTVHTYDSVSYNFNPLKCWTTVALDHTQIKDFIVYVRENEQQEMEVLAFWPNQGINVHFSRNKAVVNGYVIPQKSMNYMIKTHSGEKLGELIKNPQFYELRMFRRITVIAKDHIEVIPEYRMRNNLRGICGDFDGEKNLEFTGPQNCLYNDKVLFKYAFTIPQGRNCNKDDVTRMHRKVEEFQQRCSKRPSVRKSREYLTSLYESRLHQCYEYVYPVQRKGPALCITEQPIQKCTQNCHKSQTHPLKQWAKCWIRRNAPEEVVQAEQRGYLPHAVNIPTKFRDQIDVDADKQCRRI